MGEAVWRKFPHCPIVVLPGVGGCRRCETVGRHGPGWNGPPLSSRRSLSHVPPSAKCEHLHEDFVNDAPDIGWVNTISAISLSFSSAVTPRASDRRRPDPSGPAAVPFPCPALAAHAGATLRREAAQLPSSQSPHQRRPQAVAEDPFRSRPAPASQHTGHATRGRPVRGTGFIFWPNQLEQEE